MDETYGSYVDDEYDDNHDYDDTDDDTWWWYWLWYLYDCIVFTKIPKAS